MKRGFFADLAFHPDSLAYRPGASSKSRAQTAEQKRYITPPWAIVVAAPSLVTCMRQTGSMKVVSCLALPGASSKSATDRITLQVANDTLTQTNFRRIVDLSAQRRLPCIFTSREFVDAGGLMAYGPNFTDLYRRAATYVDKILKGAKLADLPIEQPTRLELIINLKAAKALGLTIPQTVILQADHVIE